jgi:PAS domain-containing protein
MTAKPTYEELEKRIARLKQENLNYQHMQSALNRSEESYWKLFENMLVGVAVYRAVNDGEDFVFVDLNQVAERISCVEKESILGQSVLKIFPGVKEMGLFDVFQKVYRTGKPETHPTVLYRDNRISHWAENSVYRLGSGEIVAIYRDETKRMQIERELRVERDNLLNILESMEDGVYIVDEKYNVQYANRSLIEEFGLYEERKCYAYFQDREGVCPWCKNPKVFMGRTVRWEWDSSRNNKTYDLIDTPLKKPDGNIWKLEIFRPVQLEIYQDIIELFI